MRISNSAREVGLALVVVTIVLALLSFERTAMLRSLETASLDLRFRLRGARPSGPEIAIVLVDDRSMDTLKKWPFSHRLYAKAIEVLNRASAKVIVFDLLFTEQEETVSPRLRDAIHDALAALPPEESDKLRGALTADNPDGELDRAIAASGNVYLPIAFSFTGKSVPAPMDLSDSAYSRFDKSARIPILPLRPVSVLTPLNRWAATAAGLGHVNIAFDRDGEPRYDYLALPFEGDFLPSMAVRAVAAYLGVAWDEVSLAVGEGVRVGPLQIPTDAGMRALVNYRGPRGSFETLSFVDLLEGKVPPAALSGKIVLIGASFLGLPDAYASPYGSTPVPGTERLANIIDMLLHRDFVEENPGGWPIIVTLAVLFLAALAGLGAATLPTRLTALSTTLPLLGWLVAAQVAFLHGVWLPVVKPETALTAASVAVLLFRYRIVDYQGRVVRTAFSRYLAPEMVEYLARHPDRLKLGGENRCMTMLFCDIRGFTAIAEQYRSSPDTLTHLINRFLTPMTDLILAHGGTIDKYMGDCIMAFWNAPVEDPAHADHACASALAIVEDLDRLNAELSAEAAAEDRIFTPLRVGIGLNTGECVVGNVGSDQRFDYSVLGDAVNLAARLETQSKTYDVNIVVGGMTRSMALGWAAIELDMILVYGKQEAVRIYTLLGDSRLAQSVQFTELLDRHETMLACYRARDWAGARHMLSRCRGRDPRLESLYDLYENRIEYFIDNPPGADWNGAFVAKTK